MATRCWLAPTVLVVITTSACGTLIGIGDLEPPADKSDSGQSDAKGESAVSPDGGDETRPPADAVAEVQSDSVTAD